MRTRNKSCHHLLLLLLLLAFAVGLTSGCSEKAPPAGDHDFETTGRADKVLRIVAGSENKILEPVLQAFAEREHVAIRMDYLGSLDIMRLLSAPSIAYDAVWPASSMWVSVGDVKHRVKHLQSTSITPVVFGIRDSLAESLGFKHKPVFVRDILQAIKDGKLRFTMTSATQSNSGASAYLGFLNALLDNPSSISLDDLKNAELQTEMKALLGGVERSSGSSNWLVDLYLAGDYDAMVNYEALIIHANQELVKAGREPLYVVYPEDGLTIADSPLGYIADNGETGRDEEKSEALFLQLQQYLMRADVQDLIQKTGRRTGLTGISTANKPVFNAAWGVQTERVLQTMNMPQTDALMEALRLYQSDLKKPGYTIYLLDFSYSMEGEGHRQLMAALEQIMLEDNATRNLLQPSAEEVSVYYRFYEKTDLVGEVTGGGEAMERLFRKIQDSDHGSATAIYAAVDNALTALAAVDTDTYSPAIVLMSDGEQNTGISFAELERRYRQAGLDVPVFSIMFGGAKEHELNKIADLSRGRVFDGRTDLIGAFQAVRGYN